ncbi:uncharacterized protein LOC124257439 isoform X2 [Haliotis rubra]|uniref:uncharacterized protein LOC124257439 isoform X2 n=1 Tax=Haliotis rubra TaxID=36100 RepID=UPI001EE4F0D6|nr:uncharacterized protein LOC124257439 isoform X2 [Haliotis rubra]
MSIYSTSTRGQCTPYINDLVKFVKLNIREPEVQPFMCKKVWMRNSNHLVEERKNHLWKKHYYRRQNNLSRGYHSVPWEPFQTMGGELVIDTGQLLMQTLSHVLGNKELRKHSHLYMDNQDILPPVENPPHESMSSESVEASKFSRAGFEDIMEALQITRARIAAVRAGFPYEEHVRLIENMCGSGDDQQDNDMELLSLTDLGLLAMQSRHTGESDNDMDQESGDRSSPGKPFLTSSPHETDHKSPTVVQSGDGEDIVPTSSICSSELESGSHDNKMIHVGSLLREMQERRCRDHIEYLNAIYSVILSLRRMQTRDLRSKTPLSRENLRELMKASSGTERDSRLGQVRFSRNYNRHMSMDTSLSGDTSSMSQDGGRLSILGPGVMTQRRSRVGSVMGQLAGANSRRKSRMWERDYLRVDTWDELMSLDEKTASGGSPAAMTQNIILRTLKWSRKMTPVQADSVEEREAKRQPLWQQVAMEKNTDIFPKSNRKQSKVEDNAMMVQRVKHNLGKLKHNLQMESGAELQRLERYSLEQTKMVSFKFKMQCFDDMQPRSLFENHCERMQNSVQLICANPDVEIQPSRWYDELRERTQMKIAENDPDINEALSKIGRFSQFGAKTVLYAKAKLCLLVMSLPAFEVCKISMQAALKFVMEKILVGQEEVLHHWLNQRRLPWVLVR